MESKHQDNTLARVRIRRPSETTKIVNDTVRTSHGDRLVVIRYFLDRPGYDLSNSVARLWFDPPAVCTPAHVSLFLQQQEIAMPDLLVEVYLDKFRSFMLLEGCEASGIEWDFSNTTYHEPGILNVRLTDLSSQNQYPLTTPGRRSTTASSDSANGDDTEFMFPLGQASPSMPANESKAQEHTNTTPLGLFAFSMIVGLDMTELTMSLFSSSVEEAFALMWGPYAFFIGGVLQFMVGLFEVFRNNLYGAVAFLAFGCFWMANGTKLILSTFFAQEGTVAERLRGETDPVGDFIRTLYIFAFSCVLLKQTLVMSKLTTTLLALVCFKLILQAFRQLFQRHDNNVGYAEYAVGWLTSGFAFYVFVVEFTNSVYQRDVFPTWKWSEQHSPEEVFGATGRIGTLQSKATKLRQAKFAHLQHKVRTAVPTAAASPPTHTELSTEKADRLSEHDDSH